MKQNTIRYIISISVSILIGVPLLAQNIQFVPNEINSYYFNPQNLGLSSPQVSGFMKPEIADVDYYTGRLNLNIELDHYKDPDFDIPISLRYVSDYFIPSRRSSYVGLNWNLNVGGAITRVVHGSPDDVKGQYLKNHGESYLKDGLWTAIKEGNFKQYSESNLLGFHVEYNEGGHGAAYHWGDFKYDMEPDVFYFKFGNHSGQFIINNQGVPTLIADKGYKIDLSQMTVQSYSTTEAPTNSSIKITTPDGYVYEFGGDVSYLEYYIPNNPAKCLIKPRSIVSWMLKTIIAPNGRKVDFQYEPVMQMNKYNYYISSSYKDLVSRRYDDPSRSPSTFWGGANAGNEQITSEDKMYIPFLKKVSIDGVNFSFNISNNGKGFYDSTDYTACLSSMTVDIDGYNIMKKVLFDYHTINGYMFLRSVRNNGLLYKFEYNNATCSLPNPLTASIDHWGGWKGGYETTVDVWDYCSSLSINREVNTNFCDIALLKQAIYPSGGVSVFKYEPNDYNCYYEKDMEKDGLIKTSLSSGKYAAGSRISEIVYKKSSKEVDGNIRTFSYVNAAGIGSGGINLTPHYINVETIFNTTYGTEYYNNEFCSYSDWHQITYIDISANSYSNNNFLSEYFIGYSDIMEYFADGSYNYYHYSSFQDVPDIMDRKGNIGRANVPFSSFNKLQQQEKFNLYIGNSMATYRGKLLSKKSYSNTNELVYTEKNMYNDSHFTEMYNISLVSCDAGIAAYKTYLAPCQLIQQQITDAEGVVTTQNMTYNDLNLLSQESYTASDGKKLAIQYKYPSDFSTFDSDELRKRNMLNLPIETVYLSDDKVIGATHNSYALFGNMMLKRYFYKLETDTPISNFYSINDSRYKEREMYVKYDQFGRPLHILKNGTFNHSFIWGYKSRYIIASIKNATYDDVKAGLGVNPEKYSDTDSPAMFMIDSLRSKLPNSLVTTYTYQLMKGMNSEMSPDGKLTIYDYDGYRQLIRIKDTKKQTVEEYRYNYKTQAALSLTSNISTMYGLNEQASFAAEASGGAWDYSYQWIFKDSKNEIINTFNKNSFTYQFPSVGHYTVTCILTDKVTQHSVSKSYSVSVVENLLRFKNVKTADVGVYVTEAELYCSKPVTITFRLNASNSSSTQFNVGSMHVSYMRDVNESKTISLPIGKTIVSVKLVSPRLGGYASIEMLNTSTPNVVIGTPKVIKTEKIF
ncbi:hypothetical protein [Bacteroides sp.]